MKELFKKLLDSGSVGAFDSLDNMKKAAYELGYTEEQVEDALDDFSGFPLDDDDLEEVAGGRFKSLYRNCAYQKKFGLR